MQLKIDGVACRGLSDNSGSHVAYSTRNWWQSVCQDRSGTQAPSRPPTRQPTSNISLSRRRIHTTVSVQGSPSLTAGRCRRGGPQARGQAGRCGHTNAGVPAERFRAQLTDSRSLNIQSYLRSMGRNPYPACSPLVANSFTDSPCLRVLASCWKLAVLYDG